MEKYLVVLAGPTASGKTNCAITLAEHFNTEIISADARQIYKEPRIGTAVPEASDLSRIRHHFIQTVSVKAYYNASMFEEEALSLLDTLFQTYHIVLMAGGAGLYIDAVCSGIDDLPTVDPAIRQSLADRVRKEGLGPLAEELKILDPVSYGKVDLHNPMRVLKALEISIQTGKPYSSFLKASGKARPFHTIRIALDMPREHLYDRINVRVDHMMEKGLLEEARSLLPLRDYPAMKTLGYRELFSHFDGHLSVEEAIQHIKNNSRKYARKQLTWFRKGDRYEWFHPEEVTEMIRYIESRVRHAG